MDFHRDALIDYRDMGSYFERARLIKIGDVLSKWFIYSENKKIKN